MRQAGKRGDGCQANATGYTLTSIGVLLTADSIRTPHAMPPSGASEIATISGHRNFPVSSSRQTARHGISGGSAHARSPHSHHYAAMLGAFVVMTVAGAPAELAAETDDSTETGPNIVVFLSDDMGWGQPGFNGGTEVTTPSIDRIANEGIRLTQFYVQPVCSATRGSLMTGRYPWKNGTQSRVGLRESAGMLTDERTIAEALRDAGYATWIVGKWHLGQWQQKHLPLQRGFDHHYGHYSGEIHSFTHHRGRSRRGILDWHRNERPVVESGYSSFLLADEAIALIERHDGGSPFFLYLPFNAVHNPNQAPDEYLDRYDHLDDHEQRAQLKAMDDAIGQVLAALERKDVLDDTLVMFLNDNGGAQSAGWNEPYRGKKSGFFEGGIRVPAVMRWPDEITAGSESDAMLHVVDLFPTFAGLAGADTSTGLALDGVDAWAAIAEGAASPRDEVVYADGVIRKGDWKLIEDDVDLYDPAPDSVLLYNIEDDPYEETNLASSNAAKVAELRARLDHHRAFARDGETLENIPDHPPTIYGEEENAAYGTEARQAVTQLLRGNPGPTLARIAASKARVELVYDEPLDADSVPSAAAFTVVVNPGYNSMDVTGVAVGGSEIVLTLASEATAGNTVGLTYEVPDTGAIRDVDGLEAVGAVWVTDEAEDDPAFAVTASPETIAEGASATLTVAVTNGVTFADDQTVTLAVSGTASASDYSGVGATLTLTAGTTSATATLTALGDQTDEADETVTVAASRGGVAIGSATVTIQSVSQDATLSALSLSGIDIGTFSSTTTSYVASVAQTVETTTVTATANHAQAVVLIDPGAAVSLAEGANEISVTVTAEDGTTTQTYTVTVTRAGAASTELPEATIATDAASVPEGTAASFTVTLDEAATEAVSVALSVTATGSVVSGTAPTAVTIAQGETSATVTVSTDDDSVVEDDGTVTANLSAGTGYTVGSDDSAAVTVADNDTATFTVAANPTDIDEGGSSTVRVSVSNGVTFADDQAIDLAASGTAAANDYTLNPTSLTLTAGTASVTATLTAADDTDEEDAETVVATASRDGTAVGSATVTIAASDRPLLTAQFLDMPETHDGQTAFSFELRFSDQIRISFRTLRDEAFEVTGGAVTRAQRLVQGSQRWQITVDPASDADVMLVLPTTTDCEATDAVCTSDGRGLSNRLAATVAGPASAQPEATIEADAASVTEGTAAAFTVTLDQAATEAVTVALSVTETGSVVSGTAPTAVTVSQGNTSASLAVATDDDSVVEDDGTVTASLSAGTGYTVGSDHSAEVTVADNDTATFAVTANPTVIDEGGSSTVTVSVSNGVTFADDQTIGLAVSGTAASGDYTLTPSSLTLTAGAGSVAATVTAMDDTDEEDEETVVVTASRDGTSLGSATVTIAASDEPNRAPEFDDDTSAARSVAENAAVGAAVGAAVSATDADGDTLTYSHAGTDASDFTIDTSRGRLRTAAVLDHEAGSSRSVTVSVIDGNGGGASIAVTITVTDVDEPPVAPAAPTVSGGSSTSLSVSWRAPANAGRPAVTDYDVQYREGTSGGLTDWSHTGAATAATVTGLSADTFYQVQVLARNAEGTSGWSATGEGSTQAVQPPGRVTDLSARAGDGQLTASWTVQPGADGYRVRWKSGSESYSPSRQLDVSGGSTASAVIGSLSNGTEYTVRASAYNAGGDGTWSDEATGTPSTTEDGAGEGDVRLVNGSGEHEGRVEIYHAGQWGTVCDDYWTGDDAEVVCRQLGYTGLATGYTRAHFGEGEDPIWMDNTHCEGGEARLADCAFAGWGVQNCRHSEDAGVGCDASSTLSLSDTFLSGAELTLQYSGQLGAGSTPSPRDFVVLATGADGTGAVRVEWVAVSGSRAVLGLSQAVPPSDAVTLSYLVAPMHPLEDPSGNPAESVQNVAVRHGGVTGTTGSDAVDGTHGALDSWANGEPASQAELLNAALSGAVKLERLDLSSRGLSDVSLLWGLSNLERLTLRDNAISDVSPLAELTGLSHLDLSDNRVADITALAGLAHLRRLDLSNNRISDVSALAGLANLRRLDLSNNRISDVSALVVLPRLEVLLVDGNVMDEVVWVSQLKTPVNLGLSGNRITEVSLLAGSGSLRRLDLSGNRVSDVTALGDLPGLEWLRLDRNRIADPWPLNGLARLRWVWLDAELPDVRTLLPSASTGALRVFQVERLEPDRRPQ